MQNLYHQHLSSLKVRKESKSKIILMEYLWEDNYDNEI